MVLFLTLTNNFVYKFLKRKTNKENKVVSPDNTQSDFIMTQLENDTTLSTALIELRERLLTAIGEGQKNTENEGIEKNDTSDTTQKMSIEKFKEFLIENSGKDGKIPAEKEIEWNLKLSRRQQRTLKTKLHEEGFLYKENERVYKLNIGM
jgi:hypothetical protein